MISNGSIYLIVRDFDKLVQFYKLEFIKQILFQCT